MQKAQMPDTEKELKKLSLELWEGLLPKLDYLDQSDIKLVKEAFDWMVLSHGDQRRKSGQFYIIHPVAACTTLADIGLDGCTLAATLLHDVPEDTAITLADLSKTFSSEILFLVEGVTKLSNIRYQGQEKFAENLRKMFVAVSKDLRVIFIKLADRLHNLQTLSHVKAEKQHRIALESLEIYAPIAERLGISLLQNAIEEAAFPYVYPDIYQSFTANARLEITTRQNQLSKILEKTENILTESGNIPNFKLSGRAKKHYSIFRKIIDREKNINDLMDLIAVRIIVENQQECYLVLSTLQQKFSTIENRYKDYIAFPKKNGYQSLHLNANIDKNYIFEFQIRTKEMHQFAEYGIASHFIYKGEGRKNLKVEEYLKGENLKWVKELIEIGRANLNPVEYLTKVKLDLFDDRVFIMTPKNDVINLPIGASALDFAFEIHGDIGKKARMAVINGKSCKISTILQSGDNVQIQTQKNQKPSLDWLKWVITKHARGSIKQYLKKIT